MAAGKRPRRRAGSPPASRSPGEGLTADPAGAAGLLLVLGGARSGKSRWACRLAQELGGARVLFVATADACDQEMAERIRRHRETRPASWRTVEVTGPSLADPVARAWNGEPVILLDCISLWVSRFVAPPQGPPAQTRAEALWQEVSRELHAFHLQLARWRARAVVVSNEVGWGVVPAYPSGRLYRDLLGWCNQWLAERASKVWLLVAGIPLPLKGEGSLPGGLPMAGPDLPSAP